MSEMQGIINNYGSMSGSISETENLTGAMSTEELIGGQIVGMRGLKGDKGDKGDAGTTDHTQLLNRDASSQHPESAITNLVEDLAARPSEVISDSFINLLE